MKVIFVLSALVFLFTGCASNRYLLNDKGEDSRFLINMIKKSSQSGQIQSKPIIVVDGKPYRYDYELKSNKLPVSRSDIQQIDILKKDAAIKVYGEYAHDGVILLTTKSGTNEEKKSFDFDNRKVLILLEEKIITQDEMNALNANDIESIEVIKNKDKITEYTSGNFDGVILIHLKKQTN
jgi:hypothetical protein